MTIRKFTVIVLATLALSGCGKSSPSGPTPTPTPEGKSETVRFTVTHSSQQLSLINAYLEANVYSSGETGTSLGTVTDSKVMHTKGLISEQDYRLSAGPIDDSRTYVLTVNIYNNKAKKILLYRGTCPDDQGCEIITQNHPTNLKVALAEAADLETIYQNSVPQTLRKQCAIQPNTNPCKRPLNRVYYDPTVNTCNLFSWTGCDPIEPFSNMALCQQACIR